MKSIFMGNPEKIKAVYPPCIIETLIKEAGLEPSHVVTKEEILSGGFKDVDNIFCTWGMSHFEENEIKELLPSLKNVYYAAGSVQYFAKEFLMCGVKVYSAWAANAVPVAEYTVAQMVLANKGFFVSSRLLKKGRSYHKNAHKIFSLYPGNVEANIGIIGFGMIGRLVAEMLAKYRVKISVYDPFLPDNTAESLNLHKCSLEELFETCDVVSNHVANNPQTVGMINKSHFERMKPYATFINTGRGAQVVEEDMIEVLKKREDLTCLLDVTVSEPPVESSELYTLENIVLTPHIAGSSGNETVRMAEYMLEEFRLVNNGLPSRYSVTLKMLETMA